MPDARARLELRAILELLAAQRRRIRDYAERHRPVPQATAPAAAPAAGLPDPPLPSGREMLDAVPAPALLLRPVPCEGGGIREVLYVDRNAAALAYADDRLPQGGLPPWSGPVPLYARFPGLAETAVPGMLERAFHDREPQGPETVEWVVRTDAGPVRVNHEVQITPCGAYLLFTFERGHRLVMAAAAQQLVRTCWAEWNLGDDGVEPSRGFRQVLGLTEDAPLPSLSGLAGAVTADSLPDLYRTLYEVILRKHPADCELALRNGGDRVFRMTARPPSAPSARPAASASAPRRSRRSQACCARRCSRTWRTSSHRTASRRRRFTGPTPGRPASAATGTRPAGCPTAGSSSRSGTPAATASRRPRSWPSCATPWRAWRTPRNASSASLTG